MNTKNKLNCTSAVLTVHFFNLKFIKFIIEIKIKTKS